MLAFEMDPTAMSVPPSHIALPPPPSWPDNFRLDNGTPFYTPPTSPAHPLPSPSIYFTPPTSPIDDKPTQPPSISAPEPAPVPVLQTDDHFPPPVNPATDLVLDDDGLSTLEKIYLYARSKSAYHRVFIAHALPEYLLSVTPQEAVEYVYPLLGMLAMDDDEHVKEALSAELVPIIWWFFTDCQIIPDDLKPEEAYASSSTTVTISVQAFTPILGTLLLSSNPLVGGAARFAIVDLLSRMKKADDRQSGAFKQHHLQSPSEMPHPWEITAAASPNDDDDDEPPPFIGLFGHRERAMFTQEILQQVVIGMGRLDVDYEYEDGQNEQVAPQQEQLPQPSDLDKTNPYFPPLPSNLTSQTSAHYAGFHTNFNPHEDVPTRLAVDQDVNFPGTEFLANDERSQAMSAISPPGSEGAEPMNMDIFKPNPPASGSPMVMDEEDNENWDDVYDGDGEEGEDEQAAVGRLSSMSLMAAVTASGVLAEDAQLAFVDEVERVGRDGVYWVRREASFALGALAKVVPQEVALNSLLPLFDTLRQDPVWHVRHSALFALPAILARLSPDQRRQVALETILSLSADQHPTVRSGVLEALGEVIYTFHEDSDGPPEQLIHLFLGRREDRRVRDGQQEAHDPRTPIEEFFADPKRPLICAFNFPAVAFTLGGARWNELREAYLDIASDTGSGVRKTFAASLGELAKIIGPVNAQRDLLDVWLSSIQSDEEEVRTKSIESLVGFIEVLGKEVGTPLVRAVLTEWNEGRLRGWRERELIEKNMVSWINLIGLDNISLARGLLQKGLEDNVATVRDAATLALPKMWNLFSSQDGAVDSLRSLLEQLATSSNYRRRMTFVACQQTLALSTNGEGQLLVTRDENILRSVANLANDGIEGVRIGVARFAATVHSTLLRYSQAIPTMLRSLVEQLSQDSSHEVQSYVASLSPVVAHEEHQASSSNGRTSCNHLTQLATFSRPPLPTPTGPAGSLRVMHSNLSGSSVPSGSSRDDADSDSSGSLTSPNELHVDPSMDQGENESPSESAGPITTTGLRGASSVYPTSMFQESGSNAAERVTVPG